MTYVVTSYTSWGLDSNERGRKGRGGGRKGFAQEEKTIRRGKPRRRRRRRREREPSSCPSSLWFISIFISHRDISDVWLDMLAHAQIWTCAWIFR